MPRRPTGQVLERERDGALVFALRFRAYGQRRYLTAAEDEPKSGSGARRMRNGSDGTRTRDLRRDRPAL